MKRLGFSEDTLNDSLPLYRQMPLVGSLAARPWSVDDGRLGSVVDLIVLFTKHRLRPRPIF